MNKNKKQYTVYTLYKDLRAIGESEAVKDIIPNHKKYAFPKKMRKKSIKQIIEITEKELRIPMLSSDLLNQMELFYWIDTPKGSEYWQKVLIKLQLRGL